mmetsp:Transcript_11018/g.18414  ORF Transcript_11018/g.18414 Transcript_11018/m.18414 type:complete len:215 (-) Transcript_11018:193-837(-)
MCDSEVSTFQFVEMAGDDCDITLKYKSKKGCPVFSYDKLTVFLNKYYWLWGAMAVVAGIVIGFFGNKFVSAVIGLVTAVMVFLLVSLATFQILQSANVETEDTVNWVILIVIGLIGVAVGYFVAKARKYGIALLSAWGGAMLGLIITSVLFVENKYAYYAIIIGSAIVLAMIAFKFEKITIMSITSFIGSYGIIRGISLYVGGFPSETSLHQQI